MSIISKTLKASQIVKKYFTEETFYNVSIDIDRIGLQGENTCKAMEGICKMSKERDVVINQHGHTIITLTFEEDFFRFVLTSKY